MENRLALAVCLLFACRGVNQSIDASSDAAWSESGVKDSSVSDVGTTDAVQPSVQKYGTSYPPSTFSAGAGVSLTGNPPTCVGGCTIASTVVGGVSSVTGAGTVSCSPTTGAVTCTGTGGASCPINLASCVTGTLGLGNGGTGANLASTCAGAGQIVTSGGAANLTCSGTLPSIAAVPAGPSNTTFTTNNTGNTQWATTSGDLGLNGGITSSIPYQINKLQGSTLSMGTPAAGDFLQFNNSSQWTNRTHQLLEQTSACNITTSLATCSNVNLTVGANQKAFLWATAWIHSTDSNTHTVILEVNSSKYGQVGVGTPGSGLTTFTDTTGAVMLSDSTVGTNTYQFQLALGEALGGGSVSCTSCVIRGLVW